MFPCREFDVNRYLMHISLKKPPHPIEERRFVALVVDQGGSGKVTMTDLMKEVSLNQTEKE